MASDQGAGICQATTFGNELADDPNSSVRDRTLDSAVLLEFGGTSRQENWWTVSRAFQGLQIFGATGSGKSSGSGKAMACAFMESNFCALVLTAKTDESGEWEQLAQECGGEPDLLISSEDQSHQFKFLHYELMLEGGAPTWLEITLATGHEIYYCINYHLPMRRFLRMAECRTHNVWHGTRIIIEAYLHNSNTV